MFLALNIAVAYDSISKDYHQALSKCQSNERKRIEKYRQKLDSMSSLVGQVMIQYALKHYFNLDHSEILIKRTENGRPFVDFDCDFNLAHDGNWVIFVSSNAPHCRLGVDVTRLNTDLSIFEAFKEVFSPSEWLFINAGDLDKSKRFSCLWALKEAYTKAIGCGITVPLDLISFSIHKDDSSENYWSCNVI